MDMKPNGPSKGNSAALATRRPSASRRPWTRPWAMKCSQSSSVWFHPASVERSIAEEMSSLASSTPDRASEAAIANLVFRRLVEAQPVAGHPVRDPVEHDRDRHARIAEKPRGLGGVGQPGGRRLVAHDVRLEDRKSTRLNSS